MAKKCICTRSFDTINLPLLGCDLPTNHSGNHRTLREGIVYEWNAGGLARRIEKILFLDDRSKRLHSALEKFGDAVTLVVTVKECIKMLAKQKWDVVYLDHDLNFEEFVDSGREDCGFEVVRYLVRHRLALVHLAYTEFIVHSSNPVASFEMMITLKEAGYKAKAERWEY